MLTFAFMIFIKPRLCLRANTSAMMLQMFACTLTATALDITGQSLAVFQQFVFVKNDFDNVIIESLCNCRPVTGLI